MLYDLKGFTIYCMLSNSVVMFTLMFNSVCDLTVGFVYR